MPVFFFALSFVKDTNIPDTILAFIIIHLLLYPASNGYNSYMDRDTDSIGGIKSPMQPTIELFYTTIIMDAAAIILSFFIGWWFTAALLTYIVCSRLYSYRRIRLKRFPFIGYITVILNQGALMFAMVYYAAESIGDSQVPLIPLIAASFLIGGFYPITQIYQHVTDKEDGVQTISMLLGKRGTFILCGIMYAIALTLLFIQYWSTNNINSFFILQLFFVPVVFYFLKWVVNVWKDEKEANFKNTMRMNTLASSCTNLAFITLTILKHLG
ncbi:prenyltransferase [Panacibacter ginsenosidivorans]|uniref:Prenyltransferase n=2 Tax=Panacibacter ginsenosidivorans TaxID=1813871 RepID=A0A5B8VG32_9BACT|nr:prenyltransferase [Panacibacter ginsenosidivorans]